MLTKYYVKFISWTSSVLEILKVLDSWNFFFWISTSILSNSFYTSILLIVKCEIVCLLIYLFEWCKMWNCYHIVLNWSSKSANMHPLHAYINYYHTQSKIMLLSPHPTQTRHEYNALVLVQTTKSPWDPTDSGSNSKRRVYYNIIIYDYISHIY